MNLFNGMSSAQVALDDIDIDEVHNPEWPLMNTELSHNQISSSPSFHEQRLLQDEFFSDGVDMAEFALCKIEDTVEYENSSQYSTMELSPVTASNTDSKLSGTSGLAHFIKAPIPNAEPDLEPRKRKVQKPPTTAGITLDNLKAVFGLERPEAEKRLGLKRTTFSNLSRFYGISKWPFRTIRDATNRRKANERLLQDPHLSTEKRRKLQRQQAHLQGVINLMYSDPSQSKDSNTLAVLMNIVSSRENQQQLAMIYGMSSLEK